MAVSLWHNVVLVMSLISPMHATNPGVKVRLSQNGLNYAATVAVDILTTQMQQMTIPDQTGSAHVKVGKVEYEFKNMKVTSFQKPGTRVAVDAGSGLTWSLFDAGISIHGDWHYKYKAGFIIIKDSGTFDVAASGLSVLVSVNIASSTSGQPTIHSTDCSCHTNSLDISLHGGASWLYDLFIKFVKDPLRNTLQKKICEAARKAIDVDASRELATLNVQVVIDKEWLLDYRLVTSPSFTISYMESYHKGELFHVGQEIEAPFQPPVLPSPTNTSDRMINFWISDYVLNTAGYVLHKNGVLVYNLSQNDLPDNQKVYLNTSCCLSCQCIGKFLPAIAKAYPNASVEAQMSTSEPPTIYINPSQVAGKFSGRIILSARLASGSLARLFTVEVDAIVSVLPSFDGQVLRAKVDRMTENITVIDSSIGPLSASILEFFFNYAKKAFIIPQLNKAGIRGLAIPRIEHVQFSNSVLQLLTNCVYLQTDVHYTGNTLYFQLINNIV